MSNTENRKNNKKKSNMNAMKKRDIRNEKKHGTGDGRNGMKKTK